jgi:outer membrane protein OmpA-like peptidoglycan-associated protein
MIRLMSCLLAACVLAPVLTADPLRFVYHTGDQYRYYGTSTQRVTIDGRFLQDALQEYKVSYSVTEADADHGRIQGHIVFLSQRQGDSAGQISQEFDTDYLVDARGLYTVPDTEVMPVVRNVPTLPEGELKPGDTWTADGEEVHDLRDDFGVDQLLRVPVTVSYTYDGPVDRDGSTVQVIRSDYNLYKRTGFRYPNLKLYPLLMTGYSHQRHYFNADKGREEGYDEEYKLVLTMNTGEVVEYSGTGGSHLVQAQTMDKPAVVQDLKKGLEDRGLGNVEVKEAPRGVVINLDNIRFPGESADLVPSEREKVRLIGEILKQYPDRDILVEGHTADVVSASDPQALSEARAAAVGNELLAEGVRRPDQIVYRGWGSTKPLVPNDSPENRAKNRRVEITLLEN